MTVTSSDLARELPELIAALDRRVRCVEEAGEDAVARGAAALCEKAARRVGGQNAPAAWPSWSPFKFRRRIPAFTYRGRLGSGSQLPS
jgi:hypothetical protein